MSFSVLIRISFRRRPADPSNAWTSAYCKGIGANSADLAALPELTLPRMQLFEFHDMPWFPDALRLGTTESLRVLAEQVGLAETVAPMLQHTLERTEVRRIVDLCSGSCGPLVALAKGLELESQGIEVVATDRYPSPGAFSSAAKASGGVIRGYSKPVDARRVPESLKGMRTLFNSFHHFPPDEARAILKDAHDNRQPIGIFEITNRSLSRTFGVFPGSVLLALSAAWKGKSAIMQLLSFVVPILPLTFAWDGLVSCLRTYTVEELRGLVRGLDTDYQWRSGRRRTARGFFSVTYLVGRPTHNR